MHILLFAQIKDAVGASELELKVTGQLDSGEVWARLIGLHPKLAPYQKTTRLARNGEYAGPQDLFEDADDVALIPPVSGG